MLVVLSYSFVTSSINSGCAPETVAKASKHRDPKSLNRYLHASEATKMMPVVKMAEAAVTNAVNNADDTDSD